MSDKKATMKQTADKNVIPQMQRRAYQYSLAFSAVALSIASINPSFAQSSPAKKPTPAAKEAHATPSPSKNTSETWNKQIESGRTAVLRNDIEKARKDFQSALTNAESLKNDKAIVECLQAQAELLESQDNLADALPIRQRAAQLAEKSYGPQSPKFAEQLGGLASYYARKGENANAWSNNERAMDILGKTGGGGTNPLEMATCSLATGRIQVTERSFGLADDSFKKALDLRESKLGANAPLVLLTCKEYAALLDQLDRKEEAKKLTERITLANATATASSATPTRTTTAAPTTDKFLTYIAEAKKAYAAKDVDTCKANWKLAVEAAEKDKGPRLAYALVHLSDLYMMAKQTAESEALLKRAIKVREESNSTQTLGMCRNLARLGTIHLMNKNYQDAARVLEQASDIEEKLAPSPSLQAQTLQSYSSVLMLTKNFGKAEQVCKRLISLSEKLPGTIGASKKQIATSLLGGIYMQSGRMNEGMQIMKQMSSSAVNQSPTEIVKAATDEFNNIEKEYDESEEKSFAK